MRKVFRTVAILLLCGAMSIPVVEARGRQNQGGGNQARPATHQQQPSRPGNNGGRPGQGNNHNQGTRPGGQPSQPGNNQGNHNGGRPGQGNNHNQGNRPGGQPSQPGNNHGNHNGGRPGQGNNHNQGNRPGGQPGHNPGNGHQAPPPSRPTPPPTHPAGPHAHYYRPAPPSRPMLPPPAPYYRPTPPPSWRPVATWNPFTSILGVALGTAIDMSLNSLLNSGYAITSYGNNAIYLTNVPMLNYNWPDATMYYNNGMLAGSQFVYYTGYNDPNRYNLVFNSLCNVYGMPVSTSYNGGVTTASWWGTGNQFITLSYGGQYAYGGGLKYYTTLTFGI